MMDIGYSQGLILHMCWCHSSGFSSNLAAEIEVYLKKVAASQALEWLIATDGYCMLIFKLPSWSINTAESFNRSCRMLANIYSYIFTLTRYEFFLTRKKNENNTSEINNNFRISSWKIKSKYQFRKFSC